MGVIWESVLTLLTVFGLAVPGYILLGRLFHPISDKGLCILIAGYGDGERLEGEVRSVMWLRSLGLLRCPVVIADIGLNQEGLEVAQRLTRRWGEVSRCPLEELGENLYCFKQR